jgi:DNA-directed RNA polymerase subunit RPC12/RpoP
MKINKREKFTLYICNECGSQWNHDELLESSPGGSFLECCHCGSSDLNEEEFDAIDDANFRRF